MGADQVYAGFMRLAVIIALLPGMAACSAAHDSDTRSAAHTDSAAGAERPPVDLSYWIGTHGDPVAARNRAHRMTIGFEQESVRVSTSGWLLDVRLSGYGCAGRVRSPGAASLSISRNQALYARPGLTEWYLNVPQGLEQGFTLTSDLFCSTETELDVDLEGLIAAPGPEQPPGQDLTSLHAGYPSYPPAHSLHAAPMNPA